MKLYAVIMAGGIGSRFWPRSKEKTPKQLIRIFGDNSMIQDTYNRVEGLIENENIFVITNKIQKPMIKKQLPNIPEENIIDEPFGKNTAACIGLASVLVGKKSEDAVTITLPSDHLITDIELFRKTLLSAAEFAYNSKGLVTIDVNPNRAETGYGYIQVSEHDGGENIFKVETFAEKPTRATAERFIQSGDFLWNSGMFIWRVDSIMSEFENYMPDLYSGLMKLEKYIDTSEFGITLTEVYGQLKSISIDYGIMEKSKIVYLIKGDFDWNDVGSWEAVYELSEKDDNQNAFAGDVYSDQTYHSYVFSPTKFTAMIGVSNLIVINTNDALLICHRDYTQDVKQLVDHLKFNNRTELL